MRFAYTIVEKKNLPKFLLLFSHDVLAFEHAVNATSKLKAWRWCVQRSAVCYLLYCFMLLGNLYFLLMSLKCSWLYKKAACIVSQHYNKCTYYMKTDCVDSVFLTIAWFWFLLFMCPDWFFFQQLIFVNFATLSSLLLWLSSNYQWNSLFVSQNAFLLDMFIQQPQTDFDSMLSWATPVDVHRTHKNSSGRKESATYYEIAQLDASGNIFSKRSYCSCLKEYFPVFSAFDLSIITVESEWFGKLWTGITWMQCGSKCEMAFQQLFRLSTITISATIE